MTAAQLIDHLSALPPDTPLVVYDGTGPLSERGYRSAVRLVTVRLAPLNGDGVYPRYVDKPELNVMVAATILDWE